MYVFYPVGQPQDKWGGYSEQRLRILEFIRNNNIRKVVFLSGDVHVSLAARLQFRQQNIGVYSIISSGFTWPVPGLQRFNFDWRPLPEKSKMQGNKRVPMLSRRGDYQPVQLTQWKYLRTGHREDNFCYIKTDGNKLLVQFFKARNGEMFDRIELDL